MIRNYIITTIRSIQRHKMNTLINTLGLALGVTSSLILFLMVDHLLNIDSYHKNADRIYRIVTESDGQGGNRDYTPGVSPPLTDAVRNDFSGIDEVLLIKNVYGEKLFSIPKGDDVKSFFENDELRMAYTEPAYFTFFDRVILHGNPEKLLNAPNQIVISKRLAEKYFGDDNVVNKTIRYNKKTDLIITGVMEDAPDNTDFPFEALISYNTIKDQHLKNGWFSTSSDDQCYLLLSKEQNPESIEERLPAFIVKYYGSNEKNRVMSLQPLSELHFDRRFANFSYSSISKGNIMAMLLIAIFLVVTSCINFINLSTAVATNRAKEVGIRKVLGSTKGQLVKQYLGETFVITTFSVLLSLGLAELFLMYINPFLELSLHLNILSNFRLQIFVVSLIVFVTICAGLYPAFVISGYNPAVALKGKIRISRSGVFSLRKSLVVFQFWISQVFIIGTIVLISQMDYIKNADLGFNYHAVLNMNISEADPVKKKVLKDQISYISGVDNVGLAFTNPSSGSVSVTNVKVDNDPEDYDTAIKFGDENYLSIYGIQLIAGENLINTDTMSRAVVNMEWLKFAGISNPEEVIGKRVTIWGKTIPISGVMSNFHTVSLHDKIVPVILVNDLNSCGLIAVRIGSSNISEVTNQIGEVWAKLYPDYPFEYAFVDEQIAEFYESEEKMSTIFGVFSGIAIFIGCLGLFGLASFTINQKVKEIGVRKVLGATVNQILVLFTGDFAKLIVISFIIAAPAAWWFMDQWLQSFEYRITIGPLVFLIGLLSTLIIAGITVSYKSIKAAIANPVNSLRDE